MARSRILHHAGTVIDLPGDKPIITFKALNGREQIEPFAQYVQKMNG